ncbi:hypothetical protein TESG_08644 [Trichophyton tonsurans CBS 112818]|uniref:Uncharacterized protein n=1 Tax=Trichophyton tonsurans (strain CBS 112818) TaxID=647933 RepID=F2S9U6_TRIT1|nr:hypothetical protein TESG_08644 [Trichophyton tonsurans CBS 112818]
MVRDVGPSGGGGIDLPVIPAIHNAGSFMRMLHLQYSQQVPTIESISAVSLEIQVNVDESHPAGWVPAPN